VREENHSRSSGEASLQPSEGGPTGPGQAGGNGTTVTIELSTNAGASHPAHIHDVTCAAYRGMSSYGARLKTVQDTLNAVNHGESETVISVDMRARTNGRYSINVHETAYPYDIIACGDIPRR
jgi:FtsP/CotA-like multicopper oxidase with cupredoxin domain